MIEIVWSFFLNLGSLQKFSGEPLFRSPSDKIITPESGALSPLNIIEQTIAYGKDVVCPITSIYQKLYHESKEY